jgi:hypothetical protein
MKKLVPTKLGIAVVGVAHLSLTKIVCYLWTPEVSGALAVSKIGATVKIVDVWKQSLKTM